MSLNIAYINKTTWLSNMPSTVFSTMNAYGFALNDCDSTVIYKSPEQQPETDFNEYFDLPHIGNFHVHTETDRAWRFRSNEIFYSKVVHWLKSCGKKWDFVITRDPGCLPYLIKIRKHTGAKIFYQSHNFYPDTSLQPDMNKINRRKYKIYETKYIPKLDGMMALNEPHSELYRKHVDTPVFTGYPGLKKIFEPKDNFDKKIVLYSGSFQLKKGIDTVIKAFAKMEDKSVRLILAGGRNDDEIQPVRDMIDSLNIADRANITGWLSYKALENLLREATIGTLPLKDTFYNRYLTAPSKLFDYLAFGMPVISSDMPSIRDIIGDNDCGVFIPPDDDNALAKNLDKILNDRDLYLKYQKGSAETANNYLWKDCARQMLNFMKSV